MKVLIHYYKLSLPQPTYFPHFVPNFKIHIFIEQNTLSDRNIPSNMPNRELNRVQFEMIARERAALRERQERVRQEEEALRRQEEQLRQQEEEVRRREQEVRRREDAELHRQNRQREQWRAQCARYRERRNRDRDQQDGQQQ